MKPKQIRGLGGRPTTEGRNTSSTIASLTIGMTILGSTLLAQIVLPQVVKNVDSRTVETTLKRKLLDSLHDPFSAKLRNVRFFHAIPVDRDAEGKRTLLWDDYALCGEIISKNLFGAYTGYRRFFSSVSVHNLRGAVTYTSWEMDIEGGEQTVKPFPDRYKDTCRNGYYDFMEDLVKNEAFGNQYALPSPSPATTPHATAPTSAATPSTETVRPLSSDRSLVPARVDSSITPPEKVKDVRPVYPAVAEAARRQGVVIIEITIGVNGKVTDAKILRSIPLLDTAALDAVRQWEYAPTIVNGQPISVITTVSVTFTLYK